MDRRGSASISLISIWDALQKRLSAQVQVQKFSRIREDKGSHRGCSSGCNNTIYSKDPFRLGF